MTVTTKSASLGTVNPQFMHIGSDKPIKNAFIYFDLPGTPEGEPKFEVEFEFKTDEEGKIGHVEEPEGSAHLMMGKEYNIFISKERLDNPGEIKEEECELIVSDNLMYATVPWGKIEAIIYDSLGTQPLAGKAYRIIGPDFEFTGEIGEDGKIFHDEIPFDNYILEIDDEEDYIPTLEYADEPYIINFPISTSEFETDDSIDPNTIEIDFDEEPEEDYINDKMKEDIKFLGE
jgi:hypothetical protein